MQIEMNYMLNLDYLKINIVEGPDLSIQKEGLPIHQKRVENHPTSHKGEINPQTYHLCPYDQHQ